MPAPLPPPLQMTTAVVGGSTYLTVGGELDIYTAPQLQERLAQESANGGTLVLDLGGLDFIDSSGIRVLVVAWQESQRDGFKLRLTRGSDTVMHALEIVGLLDELPFLGRS